MKGKSNLKKKSFSPYLSSARASIGLT